MRAYLIFVVELLNVIAILLLVTKHSSVVWQLLNTSKRHMLVNWFLKRFLLNYKYLQYGKCLIISLGTSADSKVLKFTDYNVVK